LADGGAYPAISPDIIVATECVAPKETVLKAFHQTVSTMMEMYDANNLANSVLADARDTLLPKLLSGELDIQEIEA
jgi:type I restriction enzyme S subunit